MPSSHELPFRDWRPIAVGQAHSRPEKVNPQANKWSKEQDAVLMRIVDGLHSRGYDPKRSCALAAVDAELLRVRPGVTPAAVTMRLRRINSSGKKSQLADKLPRKYWSDVAAQVLLVGYLAQVPRKILISWCSLYRYPTPRKHISGRLTWMRRNNWSGIDKLVPELLSESTLLSLVSDDAPESKAKQVKIVTAIADTARRFLPDYAEASPVKAIKKETTPAPKGGWLEVDREMLGELLAKGVSLRVAIRTEK